MAVTELPYPQTAFCNPIPNLKLILNHDDNFSYTHSGTVRNQRDTRERQRQRETQPDRQTNRETD